MSTIYLIAFGGLDQELLGNLASELGDRLRYPIVSDFRHELPDNAFNTERNQYLAMAFLTKMRNISSGGKFKALGITEADLYSEGLNFVFGQADIGGCASVISLARLRPLSANNGGRSLFQLRALKEAVHELGHTFGLEHCRDRRCVMHFSTGIDDTDIKSPDFCPGHTAEFANAKI